jgi:hypothetical protein
MVDLLAEEHGRSIAALRASAGLQCSDVWIEPEAEEATDDTCTLAAYLRAHHITFSEFLHMQNRPGGTKAD